jgi:hypothetical protein
MRSYLIMQQTNAGSEEAAGRDPEMLAEHFAEGLLAHAGAQRG